MRTLAQLPKTTTARAFTVTEVLIIIACLAVLTAIFLPALVRSRTRASMTNCSNNTKQISLSSRAWSLDNNDHFPMQVSVTNGGTMELIASGVVYPHFQAISNELSTPKILLCPKDKKRSWATNFTNLTDRNLSYFLNMDATSGDSSSLLCGDRNITNKAQAGIRLVSLTKTDSIAWTKEIHSEKGSLVFGDSTVGSFTNGSLGASIKIGDGKTNWLAVP